MERLTDKREADAQRKDYENRIRNGYPRNIPEERFLRLAAYEDTGLTPDEILPKEKADEIALNLMRLADLESLAPYGRLRELGIADSEGRVVVLPCKVGDTVYYRCGKRITDFEIVGFSVDRKGASIIYAEHHADESGTAYSYFFDVKKIGRTAFFTREEAERAMRKEDASNG